MGICIIGGDLRIIKLAEMYANDGEKVYTYGLEKYFDKRESENVENIVICDSIKEATSKANIVLSGMPFSKDGINVNAPFAENNIKLENLKNELEGKTFVAGGIPQNIYEDKTITAIDLLKNEKLTILNAIPTVEGTIKIAIAEREETIFESNVLVCGFGRIGKILCNRFRALGANIYCVARKEADLAWIREEKCIPLKYDEICEYAPKINIVINTVPSLVITKKELDCFNKDVLMIDVASNPGGIDKEYAASKNLKVITALEIPGKEAPKTAAKYIKEIISKLVHYSQ